MPTKKKANPQPGGRPTKYLPKYCTQVIAWGKLGKSRQWMCASLDIVEQTMINWEMKHPEFLEAMGRAKLHEQMWWEDKGEKGMETPGFSSSIWSRSMAARFPKHWRDKLEVTPGLPDLSGLNKNDLDIVDAIAARAARLGAGGGKA